MLPEDTRKKESKDGGNKMANDVDVIVNIFDRDVTAELQDTDVDVETFNTDISIEVVAE